MIEMVAFVVVVVLALIFLAVPLVKLGVRINRNIRIQQLSAVLTSQDEREYVGASLLEKSQALDARVKALTDLAALLREDPRSAAIFNTYGVNDKQFTEMYFRLVRGGLCGFWRGNWLPVLALTYGYTLSYIMRNKTVDDSKIKEICLRVRMYFDRGEAGPIIDPVNDGVR